MNLYYDMGLGKQSQVVVRRWLYDYYGYNESGSRQDR